MKRWILSAAALTAIVGLAAYVVLFRCPGPALACSCIGYERWEIERVEVTENGIPVTSPTSQAGWNVTVDSQRDGDLEIRGRSSAGEYFSATYERENVR